MTLSLQSLSSKFLHLLGWTLAAYNHGLEALLYRGDPDRNRSLFKAAADEWKVLFEKTETMLSQTLMMHCVNLPSHSVNASKSY